MIKVPVALCPKLKGEVSYQDIIGSSADIKRLVLCSWINAVFALTGSSWGSEETSQSSFDRSGNHNIRQSYYSSQESSASQVRG